MRCTGTLWMYGMFSSTSTANLRIKRQNATEFTQLTMTVTPQRSSAYLFYYFRCLRAQHFLWGDTVHSAWIRPQNKTNIQRIQIHSYHIFEAFTYSFTPNHPDEVRTSIRVAGERTLSYLPTTSRVAQSSGGLPSLRPREVRPPERCKMEFSSSHRQATHCSHRFQTVHRLAQLQTIRQKPHALNALG